MNNEIDSNTRFEIIDRLYYQRFGRLRPGKSEPMELRIDSCSDENTAQFEGWIGSPNVLQDALVYINSLEKTIERLENE